jgi:hypothetical protein
VEATPDSNIPRDQSLIFQSFGFWVFDFLSVTTVVSPCSRGLAFGIAGSLE